MICFHDTVRMCPTNYSKGARSAHAPEVQLRMQGRFCFDCDCLHRVESATIHCAAVGSPPKFCLAGLVELARKQRKNSSKIAFLALRRSGKSYFGLCFVAQTSRGLTAKTKKRLFFSSSWRSSLGAFQTPSIENIILLFWSVIPCKVHDFTICEVEISQHRLSRSAPASKSAVYADSLKGRK